MSNDTNHRTDNMQPAPGKPAPCAGGSAERIEELTEDERGRIEDLLFEATSFDKPALEKALRIIDAHAADRAALVARVAELEEAREDLAKSNVLLARTQARRSHRPREAAAQSLKLDKEISAHLRRAGWQWDAITCRWVKAETATWTETRGREP